MQHFYNISYNKTCTRWKTYEVAEDGQQLRPKHVAALTNK